MKKQNLIGILAGCGMLILILDTKTALLSAITGLQLCYNVIVPSLFPFLFLSGLLISCFSGQSFRFLKPLRKICKIPVGSESLLLVGFLAGYPVGAQLVSQAYRCGHLSAPVAKRMLGFCSNAGPAFLFGMFSLLFSKGYITWLLWGIHIFSALLVGFLLPTVDVPVCCIGNAQPLGIHAALQKATKVIATICGWVILFRIVIGFCDTWFLWRFPVEIQVLLFGFLELSNGCVMLQRIPEEGIRFLLSCPILAFGGICVGMQTYSVTSELGCGYYFPGKVLQALFSSLFAIVLYPILFKTAPSLCTIPIILLLLIAISIILSALNRKKVVAFMERMLYNTPISSSKGADICYFGKK